MQPSHNGARRLLTASSVRALSTTSPTTSTPSRTRVARLKNQAKPHHQQKPTDTVGILEQLFSRELRPPAPSKRTAAIAAAREIPIQKFDTELQHEPVIRRDNEVDRGRGRRLVTLEGHGADQQAKQQIGLLKIQGGSSTLCDADFRRLAPTGRHLDGWSVQGSLLAGNALSPTSGRNILTVPKVIPSRSPETLERTSSYYLVFRTRRSATSYRTHISTLHTLSNSPSPPPHLQTTALTAQASSYTATPPTARLQIREFPATHTPHTLDAVYALAGWSALRASARSEHEVLLYTPWNRVSGFALYRAIEADGTARRMPWALLPPRASDAAAGADARFLACMRELHASRAPHAFLSLRATSTRWHGARVAVAPETHARDPTARRVQAGVAAEASEPVLRHADVSKKFVVSFVEREEARRFALAWHGRDVGHLVPGGWGRGEVVVEAEALFE